MTNEPSTGGVWNTPSYAGAAATTPGELALLGAHLSLCLGAHGRVFALQCRADTLRAFLAGRFVTIAFAVACVASGLSYWM